MVQISDIPQHTVTVSIYGVISHIPYNLIPKTLTTPIASRHSSQEVATRIQTKIIDTINNEVLPPQ